MGVYWYHDWHHSEEEIRLCMGGQVHSVPYESSFYVLYTQILCSKLLNFIKTICFLRKGSKTICFLRKDEFVVLEISVSFRRPLCFDGRLYPDDTQNGPSDGSLQGLKSWISVSGNPDLLLVSHHWITSHQHRNEQTNKNSLRTDPTVNVLSLGTFSSQIPVASQVLHSFSFLLRLFPGSFLVLLKINHTEKVLQSTKVVCREHKNFFFFWSILHQNLSAWLICKWQRPERNSYSDCIVEEDFVDEYERKFFSCKK